MMRKKDLKGVVSCMNENGKVKNAIKILNTIILSMASKQKIFDSMNSEIFKCNIYSGYIELLVDLNLTLLNKDEKYEEYISLINGYLEDKLEIEDVIEKLKKL